MTEHKAGVVPPRPKLPFIHEIPEIPWGSQWSPVWKSYTLQ